MRAARSPDWDKYKYSAQWVISGGISISAYIKETLGRKYIFKENIFIAQHCY